jgi:hypothetical protein
MGVFKSCLLCVYFFAVFFLQSGFAQHDSDKMKAFHSISSHDIMAYVGEMVKPEYKGRLAGTPEYMNIAQWAADLLKEWGIQPAGDNASYFQYFHRTYCNVKDVGHVKFYSKNQDKSLIVKEEYYPGANSANGSLRAELVFAGHGISYPEMNYDDYEGIDVKGKIVLITGTVPYKGKDADTSAMWTFYNSHRYKYGNAFEHGASGVLIVDMMASPGTPYYENFYYAAVHESVAQYIFQIEKLNYDTVLAEISKNMKPFSFESRITAEITSSVECFDNGLTANVVGIIPGNDPILKDEYILVGAHLDGQGSLGFLLPGALDNASGVANVLAAAKALSFMKGKMKRSVMFVLFGGEECGLLGSLHYVENPILPLDKILLMLNLDMVGNGTGLGAWGGLSYPDILKHFEGMNDSLVHRPFRSSENRPVKGRPRTDGLVFLMRNIPTIHFGIFDREFPLYYHSHKDTEDLLSWETMEDAAKLLFLGVFSIANDETISLSGKKE